MKLNQSKGRFIVIEGIDGSGTTTQTSMLSRALGVQGYPVYRTREPSDGPIGSLIRQVLSRRVVTIENRAPCMETMALLFAADRMDHLQNEVVPNLAEGTHVISDRYVQSSLAYQSVTCAQNEDSSDAVEWIKKLNSRIIEPDLTIVLDVAVHAATKRRSLRGQSIELYERDEIQEGLADFYRHLNLTFPEQNILVIDGELDMKGVHELCWSAVQRMLGDDASQNRRAG